MFTIDFAKEIEESGVTINAVHPGVINTGLGDSSKLSSKFVKLLKQFWKSPEYGAESPSWLAIDEELRDVNGQYFNRKTQTKYSGEAINDSIRNDLRIKTEQIVNKK
jgi:NAD(P)-dependent dehydrogenase (short-subunit alcohol dehydrogenase family)